MENVKSDDFGIGYIGSKAVIADYSFHIVDIRLWLKDLEEKLLRAETASSLKAQKDILSNIQYIQGNLEILELITLRKIGALTKD